MLDIHLLLRSIIFNFFTLQSFGVIILVIKIVIIIGTEMGSRARRRSHLIIGDIDIGRIMGSIKIYFINLIKISCDYIIGIIGWYMKLIAISVRVLR